VRDVGKIRRKKGGFSLILERERKRGKRKTKQRSKEREETETEKGEKSLSLDTRGEKAEALFINS